MNASHFIGEAQRAAAILDAIADGVVAVGAEGVIEHLNPAAERLTGWPVREARGRSVGEVVRVMDDLTGDWIEPPIEQCLQAGATLEVSGELSLLHRDGHKLAINESATPIREHGGGTSGVVLILRDARKTREMSHQLAYQAAHDDLTGLISRREFEQRITQAIESAQRGRRQHVLCYLDLDQFRVVNDTCGHVAGDRLLREIAGVLKPVVGATDTLARLGGDEFGVLLWDCALERADACAQELISAVKKYRFWWEGKMFEIGVSIGVVPIAGEPAALTEILSFADSACYMAKERGGNRVHVYTSDDDALIKRRGQMQWLHRITEAYSKDRFVLYAQEIVPLYSSVVDQRHYEILLRMIADSGELVPPMEYIAAAERYNVIADIDRWVITKAFAAIDPYVQSRRENPDLPAKRFAVNLSGQSLGDERTCEYVREQFETYPDLPSSIIFEITETAAISNLSQAVDFISLFREMGCRFALDDFGSGLSSFAYLKNLAVDYLKIDGGFVRGMGYDPVNFAMVGSINHIGHVIGLKTIAESVESDDVADKLKDIGVDYGQGNWLSEPQPLAGVVT